MRDRMPSCMRAPPEAANRMKGAFLSTARSIAVMTASPAAMPSGPGHELEVLHGSDDSLSVERAFADEDRVVHACFGAGILEAISGAGHWGGQRTCTTANWNLPRRRRRRTQSKAAPSRHLHVIVRARYDKQVGLEVFVEDHLTELGTFDPKVLRNLALRRQEAANFGTDNVIDPVHASLALLDHPEP